MVSDEKRRMPRVREERAIWISDEGALAATGRTRDISNYGLYFYARSLSHLRVGRVVSLRMDRAPIRTGSPIHRAIETNALVVRVEPKDSGAGVALSFVHPVAV